MSVRNRAIWVKSGELLTTDDSVVVIPIWPVTGTQVVFCEARVKASLDDGSQTKVWNILRPYRCTAGALSAASLPAVTFSKAQGKLWTATLELLGTEVALSLKGDSTLNLNWWWDTETRVLTIG